MRDSTLVDVSTDVPGPKAREYVERDKEAVSPSYTRGYPFVMERERDVWPGTWMETGTSTSMRASP